VLGPDAGAVDRGGRVAVSSRLVGRTSRAEGHIYTSEIVFQYNPSSFKHSITTHHSLTIPFFDLKIPRP
jgi:hypothetical protein